jgi:hypothetical protein
MITNRLNILDLSGKSGLGLGIGIKGWGSGKKTLDVTLDLIFIRKFNFLFSAKIMFLLKHVDKH